jgi:hypothetical protein
VAWVVAAPVVHDAVLAPVIGVAAFALSRFLPRPWKVPVIAGAASSGVLAIVAFPLLWRDFAAAYPPGGHADPDIGLIVALAVVWAVVLVVGTIRRHRASPRPVQPKPPVPSH